MSSTQTYAWFAKGIKIATLEVRHNKCEMLLNVVADTVQVVRAKMAELNDGDMYPNEETGKGKLSAQFIISGGYNWNARWRDFITLINMVLNSHAIEQN